MRPVGGQTTRRLRGCPGVRRALTALVTAAVAGSLLAACSSGQPVRGGLPALSDPVQVPAGPGFVTGPIRAPGGLYLRDGRGRVVFFHGVNAVYKRPPYELYPAPGKPWNFDAHDASLLARLGLNIVRLGMTWKGLEPGTAPANDPAICTPGPARDPGQYNAAVLERYLSHVAQTVDLLGRFHIYTLLDMHQDVYNEAFDGEGAPNWAVCTNGLPPGEPPGRWSDNYTTRAAGAAYDHFWRNDVVGDLQGEYDRVWTAVATYFAHDPWVIGYDPFNEPFSSSLVSRGDELFDGQLQCFYAGTAMVGRPARGARPFTCAPGVPAVGVIPRILAANPYHLVFYEPDIFGSRGRPNFVGPMPFPRLVFNVHIYCSFRNGRTGNPTSFAACSTQERRSMLRRSEDRTDLSSVAQPGGPPLFVSEFGATSSELLLDQLTADADNARVGWTYWSWRYYRDPTGSAAEALLTDAGTLRNTAYALSRAYPQAVAGVPSSFSFNPGTGAFHLEYRADPAVSAPTVIFVPVAIHMPAGYCARATGARVVSAPGSTHLEVVNDPGARRVGVSVTAGRCS